MKDYFELLLKTYEFYATKINRGITNHLFTGMLMGISSMYKDQTEDLSMLSKAELISKKFHSTSNAKLYHATIRCMVCQAAWHHASTPKYDRQTKYGKNLHRDYHLDGYHGRKGTTKIDEPYHPRYRLYTEFH